MNKLDECKCPVCANSLTPSGPEFTLEELLDLWKPVSFSEDTRNDHIKQSSRTQLYVCKKCKLEIFLPQIIGTPNFYAELQNGSADSYYVDYKWDFEEALKDVKREKAIIEIGCGPGVFLEKASHYVDQAIGIEYNIAALETARDKGLMVFNIKDDLSGLKGQFDVAFSFHVLEHVADPVAFVDEMLRWVKPGGKVGISVPNMDGPVKYINPCVSNMPPHHATRWKLETFQALATKLDLEILRVKYEPLIFRDHTYYSIYWVNHIFQKKILPKRLLPIFQRLASKFFYRLFDLLSRFGRKEFGLLKGQSIYVLLSKRERELT